MLIWLPQKRFSYLSPSGVKPNSPTCFSSCIKRMLAKPTHPFFESVYCQRFKIFTCSPSGPSKNESPLLSNFWLRKLPWINKPVLHLLFSFKLPWKFASRLPILELKRLKNSGSLEKGFLISVFICPAILSNPLITLPVPLVIWILSIHVPGVKVSP